MAMTVKNNAASMYALNQLGRNDSDLTKQLKKVSSGMRINSAADDASGYAISMRLRSLEGAYGQDIENAQTGANLVAVAEGGIQSVVDNLRTMKEMMLNARNDTNTDADRATIQKEFTKRLETITDIAAETNYNGKLLLNGNYGERQMKTVQSYVTTGVTGGSGTGVGPYTPVSTGVPEPISPTYPVSAGNLSITESGVYVLPTGYSGTITIADGLNVKIKQQDPLVPLQNVYIEGPTSGGANLWIEDLKIDNASDKSWIKFSGDNNVLSIKGSNIFSHSIGMQKAAIDVGGGLTIEGSGVLHMSRAGNASGTMYGAYIGTGIGSSVAPNITINSGTFKIVAGQPDSNGRFKDGGCQGALIGAGDSKSIGNIVLNGGVFELENPGGGGCIGGGNFSSAGDITIKNADITARCDDSACIGSGAEGSAGDIVICNSRINVRNEPMYSSAYTSLTTNGGQGAGIGSGGSYSGKPGGKAGNIIIEDSEIMASSYWGAGIGSGHKGSVGDITIRNMTGDVIGEKQDSIGRGYLGTCGSIDIDPPLEPLTGHYITETVEALGTPLIIHTGPKQNQYIPVFINSMHPIALGINGVRVDDDRIRDKTEPLNDPSVNKFAKLLQQIDDAIDYTLNEITRMGAYRQRLSMTEDNLTTAQENTVSAKSTMADADMAKEMTGYTKANVLAQTAQSMVAQANQNLGSILDLLK